MKTHVDIEYASPLTYELFEWELPALEPVAPPEPEATDVSQNDLGYFMNMAGRHTLLTAEEERTFGRVLWTARRRLLRIRDGVMLYAKLLDLAFMRALLILETALPLALELCHRRPVLRGELLAQRPQVALPLALCALDSSRAALLQPASHGLESFESTLTRLALLAELSLPVGYQQLALRLDQTHAAFEASLDLTHAGFMAIGEPPGLAQVVSHEAQFGLPILDISLCHGEL